MIVDVDNIVEGCSVYWNDPDNDFCSGYYTVTLVLGDGAVIENEAGDLAEVLTSELSWNQDYRQVK